MGHVIKSSRDHIRKLSIFCFYLFFENVQLNQIIPEISFLSYYNKKFRSIKLIANNEVLLKHKKKQISIVQDEFSFLLYYQLRTK